MPKRIRTFIGFTLSARDKIYFGKLQSQLVAANLKIDLTHPQNFHLTTVFLGSTNVNRLNDLEKIINDSNQSLDPLSLVCNKLDGFPKASRARVVFAKFQGKDMKKLDSAVGQLKSRLKQQNFWYDDKPFIPHVTLGRAEGVVDLARFQNLAEKKVALKKFRLFESVFDKDRVRYKILI